MSFQLSATAAKHTEIRKALEAQRDTTLQSDEYNANRPNSVEDDVQARRDELEGDLVDAAISAAEAATRKLKGAGQFQVTISGSEEPAADGPDTAAPARQHLTLSLSAFQ